MIRECLRMVFRQFRQMDWHAHEDGIEAQAQAMLVDYGSPKQIERMMETVRALDEKMMVMNKAGHRHFRSSYFSGQKSLMKVYGNGRCSPRNFCCFNRRSHLLNSMVINVHGNSQLIWQKVVSTCKKG